MKFKVIGWLSEKNHATVIHATKNVKSLLDVRDAYTIDSLEQWVAVFNSVFGGSKVAAESFIIELDNVIRASGLSKDRLNNLLIMKAEEVLE